MKEAKDLSVLVDSNVRYLKAICPVTDEEKKKIKSKRYNNFWGVSSFL